MRFIRSTPGIAMKLSPVLISFLMKVSTGVIQLAHLRTALKYSFLIVPMDLDVNMKAIVLGALFVIVSTFFWDSLMMNCSLSLHPLNRISATLLWFQNRIAKETCPLSEQLPTYCSTSLSCLIFNRFQ